MNASPVSFRAVRARWKHGARGRIPELRHQVAHPEERIDPPDAFRGMPVLVTDDEGRPKCVGCSMCEYVCPPKAIYIVPQELEEGNKVERGPAVFDLNMLRCIYCGLCEEACPEEAIFMSKDYLVWGADRKDLIFHKEKLYELGGVRAEGVKKWKDK